MSRRRFSFLLSFLFCFWLSSQWARGQVLISEFMASNTKTLKDEDGDFSDWIELFNTSNAPVDLKGWSLTDDPLNLGKWKFPQATLGPGEHLVVFASNKNRASSGLNFHTNFKLGTSGDYLGLVAPDGTNIVSQYAPAYPAQIPDVSFGLGIAFTKSTLVATNAVGTVTVPLDGSLGSAWTYPEFNDSAWTRGQSGFGFASPPPAAPQTAGALAIQTSGLIGYWPLNESSGTAATNLANPLLPLNYTNAPTLAQAGLRTPEFEGFDASNNSPKLDGVNDFITARASLLNNLTAFTLSGWIKPTALNLSRSGLWGQYGAIEFGFVDPGNLQIWTAGGGSLTVNYPYPINEWHCLTATGDGEELRIYIDGQLVDAGGDPALNYGSSAFPFNVGGGGIFDTSANWFKGQVDEIAVYSRALSPDEIAQIYLAAKSPSLSYGGLVRTDISAAMRGVNSSAYARFPFVLSDAANLSFATLRMNCDDGFVAWLNGVEVARKNAPFTPEWDSSATAARNGAVGLRTEEFNLSSQIGLLHPGLNVLAIQGLNMAASDADFLILPELVATSVSLDTNAFRYFTVPTPGALNGAGATNLGPAILSVVHTPAIPADGDDLVVTAKALKTLAPVASLKLTYRVMFSNEVQVAMFDDGGHGDGLAGDGIYGARIPAAASQPGQMVRYFLTSADTAGRTNRWPPYADKLNSPQYLGTVVQDPSLTNLLPVLHWFVQSPSAADGTTGTRCSLFFDGIFYDNVFANIHGQSSTGFPKKSYNINMNTGFHFAYDPNESAVKGFNLLTTYPDKAHMRNMLAYGTYRDAGSPYHIVKPMRVQQNGKFFSDAHFVEDGDADYLQRVGLDPNGALYKMYDTLSSASAGEKKTRKFENTADLATLITSLGQSGTAKTRYIYDNVNIPAMVNYLAAMIVTGNVDCCHKNYYAYRDSEGTGEWEFLPWDQDLSFGRNWTGSLAYFDDHMYYDNPLYIGGNNTLIAALFAIPAVKDMYLRRLRTLTDDLLQPPGTPVGELKYEAQMDKWFDLISPDAALDFAKWATWGTKQTMAQALSIMKTQYMTLRRSYVYKTLVGPSSIPPAQTNNLILVFGDLDFNPASGRQEEEYLQVKNTNRVAVDISGWKLEGDITHVFKPGTVLPATNSLYLSPNVVAFRARSSGPRGNQGLFIQGNYKGQLSARGGTVLLTDPTGRAVQSLTFAGAPTPAQLGLRIIEIMASPLPPPAGSPFTVDDFEYLVLKNIGAVPLSLDGVHFSSGVNFIFPPGAGKSLAAGAKIYLVKNPEAFIGRYGNGLSLAGPFLGSLKTKGEQLRLDDAAGEKVVDFAYQTSWFANVAERGYSLVAADETIAWDQWGQMDSWKASDRAGGTAAQSDFAQWRLNYFTATELADPAISGDTADPDHDGLNNSQEFISGTDPRDAQSFLKVEPVFAAGGSFTLRFQAAANKSYSLVYRDSLTAGAWVRLTDFPAGAARPLEFNVVLPPGNSERFYRLATPSLNP